jgi:enoyl-CoA hydratase/carnithine racemase
MSDGLVQERSGAVLRLVIDRPAAANALTPHSAAALARALEAAGADPTVAVVVVRGGRDGPFCSGFDLGRIGTGPTGLEELMGSLDRCPVQVVAAVNGAAVGAGLELACRCDLRVVRAGARLGLPAVRLGVAYRPEGLATVMAVAPGARRLLLTGALAAVEDVAGFADVVAGADDFDDALAAVTGAVEAAAPRAASYTARVLRSLVPGRLADGRDVLAAEREAIMAGGDVTEAADARRQQRPAVFAPRAADPG